MTIQEAEQFYLTNLKLKNCAKNTIAIRQYGLKLFSKFLATKKISKVQTIDSQLLAEYLNQRYYTINQYGKQNKAVTRNLEIGPVKGLLRLLYEKQIIATDLSIQVEYVKAPQQTLPNVILSKQEVRQLLALPDVQTPLGYRDRMMLEILYATGLRRNELLNLRLADIDFEQATIRIQQGKGGKDRIVPVNQTALKFIQNYIRVIRPGLVKDGNHDYLLVNYLGNRLRGSLNKILAPYLKKVSKKSVHIHTLRHTVATHLLKRGMALRHLQEFLGHSCLESTTRYLQLEISDLQDECRRYHPRERVLD